MLENSLVNTNFLGRDNFVWWIGQVAHPDVWKDSTIEGLPGKDLNKEPTTWAYRCKVRIIGYHPFEGDILADKDLPWAHVMSPANEGSHHGGLGGSSMMVGGECVFGFFLDGDEAQQPVVIGVLNRPTSSTNKISVEDIKKEKSSSFRPYTGFVGSNTKGLTQSPPPKEGKVGSEPPTAAGVKDREEQKTNTEAPTQETSADTKFGEPTEVSIPNGCDDDWFAEITNTIRSFITTTNSLVNFLGTYVNAVQNALQDLQNIIRKSGLIILGIIKKILNNLRKKFIKWLTKSLRNFLGLTVPDPQLEAITKAINKILDIIFCIFEKLGFDIFGFITNFLTEMVGKTIAAPLCAAEQATAAIISKLLNELDKLLKPILDGISWLVDGLGSVAGILRQATSYLSLIMSFLDCDKLSCKKVQDWSSGWGLSTKTATQISSFLDNITIMDDLITGGEGMTLDQLAAEGSDGLSVLTLLGGKYSRFVKCNSLTDNPQTQDDIGPTPTGYVFPTCIPPKVEIHGECKKTAKAYAITALDGSILSIELINPGLGYLEPPSISIIDKTNHGGGAQADCIIDSQGRITQIYLIDPGIGYCPGTLYYPQEQDEVTDLETIPDTTPPRIRFTTPNDNSVGIDTGVNFSITFTEEIEPKYGAISIIETATNEVFAAIDINDRSQISYPTKYTVVVNPKENLKFDTDYHINITKGSFVDLAGNEFLGVDDKETYNVTTRGQVGVSSIPVGIVTSVIPYRPGIGYTSGDTGQYGNCTFDLVLNQIGSVIGIKNINCTDDSRYTAIPEATINTNTGYGAKLLPILAYDPNSISGGKLPRGRDLVIKVVDCPTRTTYG